MKSGFFNLQQFREHCRKRMLQNKLYLLQLLYQLDVDHLLVAFQLVPNLHKLHKKLLLQSGEAHQGEDRLRDPLKLHK